MAAPLSLRLSSGTRADPAWMIGAAAALLLLAVALFDPRLLNDGDTYWHIAAGDWMLRHGAVPHTDPFSFTRAGAPWHAHEWLAELAMAMAFRLDGWSGVVILYGVALGGAALLLTGELRRALPGASLVLTLALAFACIAPNLLARPHVLVLPILIAWTAMLLRAREAGRAPPLWMAMLMLLWANLHGSFVLGFLLSGAFALEALIASPRWPVLRAWVLFGAVSLCAAAITPDGVAGLLFPFQLAGLSSLAGIGEWQPSDFSKLGPFEIALAVTLFVGLSRGVKVAPVRLLLLIAQLHMALQHNRHVMVLAVVAAMVLAAPFATALGQAPQEQRPAGAAAWSLCAALALVLMVVRAALPVVRADGPVTPAAALDHVSARLRAQPVFNAYGFGGYLIFRGVRPYVDSRADLYGDAFLARYSQIMAADPAAFDQMLRDAHIAWTILPPDAPLVRVLDARAGWTRLYADQFAVVHARTSLR